MKTLRQHFRIHWPNWRRLFRYWVLLGCCLSWTAAVQPASAQASELVSLTVKLRHSDGTAVVGETIILERLPEEEPIPPALRQAQSGNCITDARGSCSWTVGRGLYQVLFARPLDDISSLAVAEGGLRGFGITVGDQDIDYYFTFHNDGRVYFDAAPEAAVPSPIIPAGEALHGGIAAPTLVPPVVDDELVEETPTPEPTNTPDTAVDTTSGSSWRLILFIGGGLVIGGGLHLLRLPLRLRSGLRLSGQAWSRKKQTSGQKTKRLNDQATKRPSDQQNIRPNDEETNHA